MSRLTVKLALPAALMAVLALGALPLHAQCGWSQDSLSVARKALASTSDGQRVYFAGGRNSPYNSFRFRRVDIFDTATQTWSQASLSVGRSEFAATAVGHYVLFAGGSLNATDPSAVVDVLDTQTMTWSTAALSQARSVLAATTVGTKAFFAGGNAGGFFTPNPTDVIDVYDSALGHPGDPLAWSTAQLSVPRAQMAGATVGPLALFAGGINITSALATVDIFDDSTGTWSTANLSQARHLEQYAAATLGSRVYFGGGAVDPTPTLSDRVDVFESTTNTWTTLTLSVPRASLAVEAVGDLVLFAGGLALTPGFDSSDVVDVLQASTGAWLPPKHLSVKRHNLSAAAAGDQVLFAGGDEFGNVVKNVDMLTWCPVGQAFCFGDGSATPCPCSNHGAPGAGCRNSTGHGALLLGSGTTSVLADDLELAAAQMRPGQPALLFVGDNAVNGGDGLPFGDGLRCAGAGVRRLGVRVADGSGAASWGPGLQAAGAWRAGDTRRFQAWYRDPNISPCGSGFNLSHGYELLFTL